MRKPIDKNKKLHNESSRTSIISRNMQGDVQTGAVQKILQNDSQDLLSEHLDVAVSDKPQMVCVVSREVITPEHHGILRFMLKNDECILGLTSKFQKNAVYMILTIPNIKILQQQGMSVLGDMFSSIADDILINLPRTLCALYEKKICAGLGFALKAKKALIGQRAIERKMINFPHSIGGLLIAEGASTDIATKIQALGTNIRVIKDFPVKWLQNLTAREKIAYFALIKTNMNHNIYHDYALYCTISKI